MATEEFGTHEQYLNDRFVAAERVREVCLKASALLLAVHQVAEVETSDETVTLTLPVEAWTDIRAWVMWARSTASQAAAATMLDILGESEETSE